MPGKVGVADFDAEMITRFFQDVVDGFIGLNPEQAYNRAALLIDSFYDQYDKNPKMKKIQCRPSGCFACCITQREIDTSPFELNRILDRTETEGRLEDVVKRAARAAGRPGGGACPLLSEDGRCTVYDIRPLSCRMHHSFDREGCHKKGGRFKQNNQLRTILALTGTIGMHGVGRLLSGKGNPKFRLFEQLAKLGRSRLQSKEAA